MKWRWLIIGLPRGGRLAGCLRYGIGVELITPAAASSRFCSSGATLNSSIARWMADSSSGA
jgi:hypothetical protein